MVMDKLFYNLPKCIIDGHVHGRDIDESHKSTVMQTLYEAALSGISIVNFMPNTKPAVNTLEVKNYYFRRIDFAESRLDYRVQGNIIFGVTDNNLHECEKALEDPRVPALKIYAAVVLKPETILGAMQLAREKNKALEVHADDPKIIAVEGYTIRAEVEYDKMIIALMRQVPGVRVKICHVSCRESAELILAAQAEGLLIAMEICPQYLWFDNERTNWRSGLAESFYLCLNRLRSPADREYLVSLLKQSNNLIMIASDHAPHLRAEKLKENPPSGFPSLHERVPVAVTLALRNGISEEQVARLISFNEADFLGMTIDCEMQSVELIEKKDDFVYNNGAVENPWLGIEFFFPVWTYQPMKPEIIF
jgi:dihydroorotase